MKTLKPIRIHAVQGLWQSHFPFIWGAAGSAVGLINLWRFPSIVGEHGGGAFVLVYLLCVFVLAIPIMLAEILIGKRARVNPVYAIREIAREAGVSPLWGRLGWLVVLASLMILPVYSVIGGWAMEYLQLNLRHQFVGISEITSRSMFVSFMQDSGVMLKWHSLLIVITVALAATGVRGLAWVLSLLVPGMFVLMSVLMVKAMGLDDSHESMAWVFELRWQQMGWDSLLLALGHGFLTLGVGLGAVMAYAAYLPDKTPMGRLALNVGGLDLIFAIMASLAVLPLIFFVGQEPLHGPELLFISLPAAFGQIEQGVELGGWFYGAVTVIAITSTIALLEPLTAYLLESKHYPRWRAAITSGAFMWLIGVAVLLSFNHWQELKLLGMTVFELLDYVAANLMMPLAGLLMIVLVAWWLPRESAQQAFSKGSRYRFKVWLLLLKYIAPILIVVIFIMPAVQKLLA